MDKQNISDKLTHISKDLKSLLEVGKMFEKWHTNLSEIVDKNKKLREKNEDLSKISKTIITYALNARIVAAKAGALGAGFQVVSKEITTLAETSQDLSQSYLDDINSNDVITMATFQDVQAGGRIIITKIVELEQEIKGIENDL